MNVNLVFLNNDLRGCIFKYLRISEYGTVSQTCKAMNKFCSDPIVETIYWRAIYQNLYSSRDLQEENNNHENPWKNQIKKFEERLKEKKIFSNKFRVCVELKCEKMGSLKEVMSKVHSDILTICLRDLLIKKCGLDKDAQLELAKKLLDHGANSLHETNVYLEDFPLRIALLNDNKRMVNLFIKYIHKNKKNKILLNLILTGIKKKIANEASSVLEDFNHSF